MPQDTAVGVLREIIEGLGGTTDAETVVPALRDLQAQIGEGGLEQYVNDYLTENPETITGTVTEYLTEQGASVTLTVTDGDLDISIT